MLDAEVCLAQNDGPGAARRFEAVADRLGTGPQAEAAAFNAVLGWLRATDVDRFTSAETEFSARFPGSRLNGEFPLEEGLARAGLTPAADTAGRRRAAACLRQFLRENPESPRAAEARLALAELAFERPRPAVPVAWRELAAPDLRPVANDTAPAPAANAERDRAAYLAIWLADAPGRLARRGPRHHAGEEIPRRPSRIRVGGGGAHETGRDVFPARGLPERPDAARTARRERAGFRAGRTRPVPRGHVGGVERERGGTGQGGGAFRARRAAQRAVPPAGATPAGRRAKPPGKRPRRAGRLRRRAGGDGRTLLFALKDEDLEARCAALCGRGQTLVSLAATFQRPEAASSTTRWGRSTSWRPCPGRRCPGGGRRSR